MALGNAGYVMENNNDTTKNKQLGTKWLKFWNYFSLPVGGLLGLVISLAIPGTGIILIPYSILQFFVVYGLHCRKRSFLVWNKLIIIITYLSMLVPVSMLVPAPSYSITQFAVQFVLATFIWLWPNHVYWKKRECLFF